jgi:hypothetical protein
MVWHAKTLIDRFSAHARRLQVKGPKGLLTKAMVNRYLSFWHLDQPRLLRDPPAVRFQAEHSNDCWQFDISPSDRMHLDRPDWIDPATRRNNRCSKLPHPVAR